MRFFAIAKQIYLSLLDVFFPRNCAICGKLVEKGCLCRNICQKCASNIAWISSESNFNIIASIKAELKESGVFKNLFSQGFTCWEHVGIGRKIILALKYQNCDFLARDIAQLVLKNRSDVVDYIKDSILVPVPLSYRKRVKRDYNQSMLIARELAKLAENVKVKNLLKARHHGSQTRLSSPKERSLNVKNIFFARNYKDNVNKRVIVVDDVITTGSTISACCEALFAQGFVDVNVLTLSHG